MYADSTTAETTAETTTDGFDADELRLALEASTKETSADVLAVELKLDAEMARSAGRSLAAKFWIEPRSGVEPFQLCDCQLGDLARPVGRPIARFVMDKNEVSVATQHHVEFNPCEAHEGCGAECCERILGSVSGDTTMSDNFW